MTDVMSKTFSVPGDWRTWDAVQKWLTERGFSVGRMQAHEPSGVLFGSYDIQKWRNLRTTECTALHGVITGDYRSGPMTVRLLPLAPGEAVRAFLVERVEVDEAGDLVKGEV